MKYLTDEQRSQTGWIDIQDGGVISVGVLRSNFESREFLMSNKIIVQDVADIILYNKEREILLQKKDLRYPWFPGQWCLPGGGIEGSESPQDCLRREMLEEYGYNIGEIQVFAVQDYKNILEDKIKTGKQYCYVGKFDGTIADLSIREGAGLGFFDKSEIYSSMPITPIICNDMKLINRYFDEK